VTISALHQGKSGPIIFNESSYRSKKKLGGFTQDVEEKIPLRLLEIPRQEIFSSGRGPTVATSDREKLFAEELRFSVCLGNWSVNVLGECRISHRKTLN
jgi:hypothetical protein